MTHIPNEIVNHIIGYAKPPKPIYVSHLDRISRIVAFKEQKGFGDYRIIDYLRNVYCHLKNKKINTYKQSLVIYQLKHLIFSYNYSKDLNDVSRDVSLGKWYKWVYEFDTFYTSGDENYETDESYSSDSDYSSEDD